MLTRRFVLSMVAVCGLVLSSAGSAEACFGGGCGCGGGFLRGLFGHHGCCNDCGCDSCGDDCGCGGEEHGDCGCGGGEVHEMNAAPAHPEAAPAAPVAPEKK
jgi:hypothetical protein